MQTQTRAQQIVGMLDQQAPIDVTAIKQRQRFGIRAKQVLIMRYLHDMTLEQVGQTLGITRERVRQIEAKALRMIRAKADLREKIRDTLAALDAR
jgi:DNA-directed RNA polymerase sigma subunit (sigma70/sigma32)